jgi:hypothetical protein
MSKTSNRVFHYIVLILFWSFEFGYSDFGFASLKFLLLQTLIKYCRYRFNNRSIDLSANSRELIPR